MGSRHTLGDSDVSSEFEEPTPSTLRLRSRTIAESNENQSQPRQATQSRRKKTAPTKRGVRALREIRLLQMRTDFMIPRLPFSRLVREIICQHSTTVSKVTSAAFAALQTATEAYIEQKLHDAYMLTLHRKCVTLHINDMRLLHILRID